jgi:hypothetical protein
MRKVMMVLALALLVPAVALASGKPPSPGKSQTAGSNAAPKVMYVLKGTLTAYTAANGSTDGSVTIMVTSSNRHGQTLKNQQPLTIAVSSTTKLVGLAAWKANDKGIVKVRAPKNTAAAALVAALQAAKAWQVIDQASSSDSD